MGLFGSLIKTAVKAATLPVALGVDVVTSGASMAIKDNGRTLTEDSFRSLSKELKKVSKGLDNL